MLLTNYKNRLTITISLIAGDPNGAAYPKTPVRDSLAMSAMTSSASAVSLSSRLPVAASPRNIENHVDTQHTKMTAISTAFKATESSSTTVATSSQLSSTVEPTTATVVGVSPDHNKYLHKKFKRIASTTLEPHAPSSNSVPSRHQASHQHNVVDQNQRNLVPNGQPTENESRLKEAPIVHLHNNHFQNSTRQDYASNSTSGQTTNTFSGNMTFNEATEANATAKANTPQSSPLLQKNNHLNNNNYSPQHNNNNIGPPQHQQPQRMQNGTTASPLMFMPTLVSNKSILEPQELQRPLYYQNSPSPSLQDTQSAVLLSTPDQAIQADAPKHPQEHQPAQQQQRFQPQLVPQQHQFQSLAVTIDRTMSPSMTVQVQQQPPVQQPAASDSPTPGRYVCPFCQLNCAKPSVLQKHIRAHTNERPYPCEICGFAFKTRSNLYKHRRYVNV